MSTETFEHTFEVEAPARLKVSNVRGHVDVTPGEDGVIRIEVITHPEDGNPDETRIELNQDADGCVRAKVSMPETYFGIGRRKPMRVDFRIQAPVPGKSYVGIEVPMGDITSSSFERAPDAVELGRAAAQAAAQLAGRRQCLNIRQVTLQFLAGLRRPV